ncbi:MAG: hypothetical protein VCG02_06920, partial [Verrucomicrobiota bacterium]
LICTLLLGLTVFTRADTWKKPTFWYMGVVNQHHKGSQKVGKGTATLISPQWALTAKHVAQFKIGHPNGGAMEIVFGSGERAYVTKAYPAPGEDIALCRLNRTINSIEKTALMTGCWAGADGLVTFTHVGKSGGLHWKRNVKGRGSCHGFDIKNGNPGKAGDSGGFFGFERSGCRNVQFSVIHGGGNGPQVGPLKAWITNTINTHGGDQPEWVTKSEVRNGMPGSNHTWSGGGASKKWNDYNNWSTCGKPGVSGNSNTANSEIAQLAYKADTAKYQPEPQLENNWSIGKIVFKKSTHHDLTVRDDSSWNVNNGSNRRRITLNGNSGEGIWVEDDVQGSYVYDFEQGIRIVMANDLDWRIDGDETLLLRGRLSGSGKLTKLGTGTLEFVDRNGQCTNNGSTDLDLLLGTVVLNKTANSTTIGGDILINGPGATLRLENREQIGDNATVTVQSGLFHQNNWHETIGTLSLRGGAMISGSLTGTADIDARSGVVFSDLLGTAGLNKVTTGTVSLYGSSSYSGPSTISKGELRIMGSHEHAGDYAVNGGTLSGNGTIDGPTMIAAGGTLAPGAGGIGSLGIHNDVSLEGSTRMEINGDTLAADQVTGMATIHYGGTLELVLIGGTLDEYDGFLLFDAQSYTGAFTTLNFPAIPSNLVWRTETLHEDGSISIGDPAKPLVSNTGISALTVTNATLNGTLV